MRRLLPVLCLLLALPSTGCVEELVVGLRQPLDDLDDAAVLPDADVPDAAAVDDAAVIIDAEQDAVVTPDAAIEPDACVGRDCEDSTFGPCNTCDLVVNIGPAVTCPNGASETCWDDGSGKCGTYCPDVPSCRSASDCASDEYCYFSRLDCGEGGVGLCAPRPRSCLPIQNTTCACDGLPYFNPCEAYRAGQAVGDDKHQQDCKK